MSTPYTDAKDDAPPQYSSADDQDLEKALLPEPEFESPLPAETATAETIRFWLAMLLQSKYIDSAVHAEEAVSNWKLGTGHELRTFTPQVFREIFGDEAGWILFREVKVRVEAEKEDKEKKPEKKRSKQKQVWIFKAICALVAALLLVVCFVINAEAMVACSPAGLLIIVVAALMTFDPPAGDKVKKAESDLRASYLPCSSKSN